MTKLLKYGNVERIDAAFVQQHAAILDVAVDLQEQPLNRWSIRAAQELAKVLVAATPWDSAVTVASLFLLRAREPKRFASDRAFDFQVVRRWRQLADHAFGSYFNEKTGSRKLVYKDLRPGVVVMMARVLVTAYARFGGHIVTADARALGHPQALRQNLDAAFAPLNRTAKENRSTL